MTRRIAGDDRRGRRDGPAGRVSRFDIQIVRRAAADDLSDRRIRRTVRHVLRRHKVRQADLEIVILGAAGIRRLNEQWLGHEGPTDVITFDLADPPGDIGRVAGQINVCRPIARAQARRRRVQPAMELLLYVVHGLLHLLGYDDRDEAAAARMHRMEDTLLNELGCGAVYAAAERGGR